MTLADQIKTDANLVFNGDANDFAEAVTYVPHRYSGEVARSNRSIFAQVFRHEIVEFGPNGNAVTVPMWEVHVDNDVTTGITSAELDLGGDQITLAPRVGETAINKSVIKKLEEDSGMLVLECR